MLTEIEEGFQQPSDNVVWSKTFFLKSHNFHYFLKFSYIFQTIMIASKSLIKMYVPYIFFKLVSIYRQNSLNCNVYVFMRPQEFAKGKVDCFDHTFPYFTGR